MLADSVLSRPMALVLLASIGAQASFTALLSVAPLFAAAGGAGQAVAGWCTGATMLATVLLEPLVPALVRRFGGPVVFSAGLLLLGLPVLVMTATSSLVALMVVCCARGAGLGIVVVTGISMVATLTPAGRRGQGLGLYSVALGLASIAGLPGGVWSSEHLGFPVTFAVSGAMALVALGATASLPRAEHAGEGLPGTHGLLDVLRGGTFGPWLAFAVTAAGAGALLTFLPIAVPAGQRDSLALALLAHSVVAPIARWAAGAFADRHRAALLLAPAVVLTGLGAGLASMVASPWAVLAGLTLLGAGFGAAGAASLMFMLGRAPGAVDAVSAVWNVAYDGGIGLGAVGFGLLVDHTGYRTAFLCLAVVQFAAVVPASGPATRQKTGTAPVSP